MSYDLSDSLSRADFAGDIIGIHGTSIAFDIEKESGGFVHAVFGDYYRGINNPGVAVLFGTIYGSFGPYPTAAGPWSALAMGCSGAIIGEIGRLLKAELDTIRISILIVLLMPLFFVAQPIYRDQIMIFLLLLSAYSAIYALRVGSIVSLLILIPLSAMLGGLRSAYVFFPSIALASYSLEIIVKDKSGSKVFRHLSLLLIFFSLAFVFKPFGNLTEYMDRAFVHSEVGNTFESLAGVSYIMAIPVKIILSILTPFPWWQNVHISLLVYQVFAYPQTLVAIMIIIPLIRNYNVIRGVHGYLALILMFVSIYIFAFVGSLTVGSGYWQLGLPLIVLPAMAAMKYQWKSYLKTSLIIVIIAHVIFLFVG